MRDLITKQTAALMGPGGAMSLYNPESLRSPRAEQEILDAENRRDQSSVILKDILTTLKKSLIVQEDMEASLRKLSDVTRASYNSSVTRISQTSNTSTASRTLVPLLPSATARNVPIVSSEDKRESLVLLQRQTDLLQGILNAVNKTNTDVKEKKKKDKATETADAKSPGIMDIFKSMRIGNIGDSFKKIFDILKSSIAEALSTLGAFLKKNIKSVLKGFLKGGLVGVIFGLISGIIDGFKEYVKSGDIGKALVAGVGGLLEFLTFGLFNKDDVEKWLKGAMDIWNNLGEYVDKYLVTPVNNFVDFVGQSLNEYIVQPISEFVDSVGTLFKQHIMDPVSGFLQSVTNVFSSITDSLVAFLNGFEIPKVSVNLPVVGEVSAGPWKPFAGIASAIKGGGNVTPSATPSAPPTNSGNAVATTSASNEAAKQTAPAPSAPVVISAPSTNVQNKQNITMPQPVRNPDMSFNRYMSRGRVIV